MSTTCNTIPLYHELKRNPVRLFSCTMRPKSELLTPPQEREGATHIIAAARPCSGHATHPLRPCSSAASASHAITVVLLSRAGLPQLNVFSTAASADEKASSGFRSGTTRLVHFLAWILFPRPEGRWSARPVRSWHARFVVRNVLLGCFITSSLPRAAVSSFFFLSVQAAL